MDAGARGFSFARAFNDKDQLMRLLNPNLLAPSTKNITTQQTTTIESTTEEAITTSQTKASQPPTTFSTRTKQQLFIDSTTAEFNLVLNSTTSSSDDVFNQTIGLYEISSGNLSFVDDEGDEVLCGRPIFVLDPDCHTLNSSSTLWDCSNQTAAVFYLVFFTLLGLVIILFNLLLPFVVYRVKHMRTRFNYLKVSLAIADLLLGFICLGDFLPNSISFLKQNRHETAHSVFDSINSPRSLAASFIVTLTFQLSCLHLLVMHMERLAAILYPFKYRTMNRTSLILEISVVWIVSIALTVVQVSMPTTWISVTSHVIFFSGTTSEGSETGDMTLLLYSLITIVLPLAITIILTVLTGILIIHKLGVSKRMRATFILQKAERKRRRMTIQMRTNDEMKQEASVFATTVLMVTAFCITWVPFIVLSTIRNLDCDQISTSYSIAFMLLCLNCLANPIIYTIRDKNIRICLRKVLTTCKKQRNISTFTHTARTIKSNVDSV